MNKTQTDFEIIKKMMVECFPKEGNVTFGFEYDCDFVRISLLGKGRVLHKFYFKDGKFSGISDEAVGNANVEIDDLKKEIDNLKNKKSSMEKIGEAAVMSDKQTKQIEHPKGETRFVCVCGFKTRDADMLNKHIKESGVCPYFEEKYRPFVLEEDRHVCPKTLSGKHWFDDSVEWNRWGQPKRHATKCEACGMIDDTEADDAK